MRRFFLVQLEHRKGTQLGSRCLETPWIRGYIKRPPAFRKLGWRPICLHFKYMISFPATSPLIIAAYSASNFSMSSAVFLVDEFSVPKPKSHSRALQAKSHQDYHLEATNRFFGACLGQLYHPLFKM